MILRRLRFDFALETNLKTGPELFILKKLVEAQDKPKSTLLKEYVSRIASIIVARDSNPANSKKPFLDCVQPAVETALVLDQACDLLAPLSLKPPTEVLTLATRSMREMFEEVSFESLKPW